MRYRWRWAVTCDSRLTLAQLRLLLALDHFADPDGSNARPGARKLADTLGLSQSWVSRQLGRLVELGYLTKTAEGGGRNRAAVYRLTLPKTVHSGPQSFEPETVHSGGHSSEAETMNSPAGNYELQAPETMNSGVHTTSPFTPDPISPEGGYVGREPHPRATPDPPPPRHCPEHPGGTDRPCAACGRARHRREDWDHDRQRDELADRRRRREQIGACSWCDDNGWRHPPLEPTAQDVPALRCDHSTPPADAYRPFTDRKAAP
ncbi:winged helix-turn-helix domain-containing protein [Rhodococcus ruber]|uniref:winged helix-turn-helix domain-containing protein n=1 Tax=Rhodococcus ruber TaxID=1830 RepID=UPI001CD87F7D